MKNKLLLENAIKNILIVILLYFLYRPVQNFLESLATDAIGYQTIIVLSSLLIMAFLFAAYSFTFKDSQLKYAGQRLCDYLNSGITMFGCGALLEISYMTINLQLKATFGILGILMILFYVSLVLFDFWDLMRGIKHQSETP